jgi:hypothetical protein
LWGERGAPVPAGIFSSKKAQASKECPVLTDRAFFVTILCISVIDFIHFCDRFVSIVTGKLIFKKENAPKARIFK